jgi:sugar transferase EpsL
MKDVYRKYGKRFMDLILLFPGITIMALPMMGLGLLVRIFLGTPVLFRQQRPGLHGRPFTLYKFRSMTNARNIADQLLPDDQRLTRFGKFLRATSLDELPELFNILAGHMSLVGPRPLLMEYLDRYSPDQARRHEVKPGITGWAQIKGRNAISWDEKFKLDVWYVDHLSLILDVKIIGITIWKIIIRENINQPGHATSEEFKPSNPLGTDTNDKLP